MTVAEYFNKKSSIVKAHFSNNLNFADNITEVKQWHLSPESDLLSCPYCIEFIENDCIGCPAITVDKQCTEAGSRIDLLKQECGVTSFIDSPVRDALVELINEYNTDLDNGNDNGL